MLRAFLTQAPWHIEANEEKDINWCDAKGCLSISAVAESKHGLELQELLQEGIGVEVLSFGVVAIAIGPHTLWKTPRRL